MTDADPPCCEVYAVMQTEITSLRAFLSGLRQDKAEMLAEIDAILAGSAHERDLVEMEELRGLYHNTLALLGKAQMDAEAALLDSRVWRRIANGHARQLTGFADKARAVEAELRAEIKELKEGHRGPYY